MKSKSKTTSNQTTNQTATTTPNTPDWLQQPWQQYTGQVNDLMNNGGPLVAGPSDLQNQAFQGAANLQSSPWFDQAAGLAGQAGGAGANTAGQAAQAGVTGYNAAGQAQANGYTGQGYQAAGQANVAGWDPAQAGAQGYDAQTYNPATGQAVNAQSGQVGQAQTYNPATIDWSQFGVQGSNVGQMAQASNRDMTREDIDRLMNTGLNDMIDSSRADYDATAGQVRAAQASQAAMNGGARNSNNAVQAAITEGELSRAQNTGLSGLRYDAYNTAAGLAQNDLSRAAQTSQFNAGQTNQGLLTQAQLDAQRYGLEAQLGQTGLLANMDAQNQAGQFNAGQQNQFGLTQAGFDQQTNQFNAGAQNQFGLANMDAQNQAGQFNAGQQNAATQFGAGAQNNANMFNAGAQNDMMSQLAQMGLTAGMDAAGRQDAASQFGAGAQNQANQFGAQAQNNAALDAAGRQDTANQFTAGAMNSGGQFNAAAQNNMNQFNAGQMDQDLARQLQAAGLLGNLGQAQGADQRANIGQQADLGAQQRDISNAQQQEEYARLAMLQQLLGGVPMGAFTGQTATGNSQSNGTQTTTQNPGLGGLIGGVGGMMTGLGGLGWSPFGGSK